LVNNPWAAVESDSEHERQLDDHWARHLDEEEDDQVEGDDDEDEEEEDDDDYEDAEDDEDDEFHDAEDGEEDDDEDEDAGKLLTPELLVPRSFLTSHQMTEKPWNSSSHQELDKKAAYKPFSAEAP
jgi:hypothetical protein